MTILTEKQNTIFEEAEIQINHYEMEITMESDFAARAYLLGNLDTWKFIKAFGEIGLDGMAVARPRPTISQIRAKYLDPAKPMTTKEN